MSTFLLNACTATTTCSHVMSSGFYYGFEVYEICDAPALVGHNFISTFCYGCFSLAKFIHPKKIAPKMQTLKHTIKLISHEKDKFMNSQCFVINLLKIKIWNHLRNHQWEQIAENFTRLLLGHRFRQKFIFTITH